MKKYTFLLLLAIYLPGVSAQNYMHQLEIDRQFEKTQKEVTLDMHIHLNKLDLDSRHLLMLTPVLESEDGSVQKELPPMVVTGKNRTKVISRMEALGQGDIYRETPYTVVARQKKESQQISYNQTLPYESWMRNGRLILREEVAGCVNCELSEDQKELMSPLLGEPYKPVYKTSFVTPEVEEIKNRDEVRELRLTFKVNSVVLQPDIDNNRSELEKVDSIIRAILYDDDLTLTNLKITGYASPEGGTQANLRLSEGRARALADYISATHGINKNQFSLFWKGEDWEGLEAAVQSSEMTEKEKEDVLDIIRNTESDATRKSKLQAYNGGRTYRWMLAELYPSLRRNNCIIDFTVRQFELEKAREMIRTNPKLMSLNEMYIVATSYPAGSAESQEAFDIAVRMFPTSPAAANNSAADLIEKGDYRSALSKLELIKEQPESWTNLGIVLAEMGRYEEAKEYFNKASQQGSVEARQNLVELEKLLEDL
ncbi:MAG: DUF3868 domain-containing protein [Tannerellaceae bacterium]|nr:DUF3868 domain-containing protein [Tannerellaceae bacterium]